MIDGGVSHVPYSTWKFGEFWNALQNADFQAIFARTASAVTPSKKFN